MEPDELATLNALPDRFTIYRGYLPRRNLRGWSWTLDQQLAEWFARRTALFASDLGLPGRVAKGRVAKADVVAYFDAREEREVVVDPASVRVVKRWDVLEQPPHPSRPV